MSGTCYTDRGTENGILAAMQCYLCAECVDDEYGLRRRDAVNDDLVERVRDLIMLEICTGPNSLSGYRTMWYVLRLRHTIHVPRWLVELLMREVDPSGVELRKHRRLHCRMYVSPGANFCWHIDDTTN